MQMCSVLKVGHSAVGKLLTVHNLDPLCLLFSNQQKVSRNNRYPEDIDEGLTVSMSRELNNKKMQSSHWPTGWWDPQAAINPEAGFNFLFM